jgi:hypothetical protein
LCGPAPLLLLVVLGAAQVDDLAQQVEVAQVERVDVAGPVVEQLGQRGQVRPAAGGVVAEVGDERVGWS